MMHAWQAKQAPGLFTNDTEGHTVWMQHKSAQSTGPEYVNEKVVETLWMQEVPAIIHKYRRMYDYYQDVENRAGSRAPAQMVLEIHESMQRSQKDRHKSQGKSWFRK